MSIWKRFVGGFHALLHRQAVERDLDEELRAFLEQAAEAHREAGVAEDVARREAAVALGSLESAKEEVRSVGWESVAESLGRDVGFAVRTLRRSPAYTLVAVLTLALGIGVNTIFFDAVRSILLRPLPYPHAERLMHIWSFWPGGFGNIRYADYVAAKERSSSFEALAACESWGNVALTGGDRPQQLRTSFVTGNYLTLMGARPAVGRLFGDPDNASEGGHPVVVLSYELWQRAFGGSRAVVGQTIRLNRAPYTVIGALGPGFHDLGEVEDPPAPDVWLPAAMGHALLGQPPLADKAFAIYWGLGLLKPGISVPQARQELRRIARQLEAEQPDALRAKGLDLEPVSDYANGQLRRPLLLLVVGAVLVLLIGCANIASSALARLSARRGELALRSALGASTARLVRQLLVECGVVAIAGGGAGILLAVGTMQVLARWARENVNSLIDVHASGATLAIAAGLSAVALPLLAVIPALHLCAMNASAAARGGRRVSPGHARARRLLVTAELAFSVVLLTGAGLMLRSFQELTASGLGFPTERLLTFRLSLTGERYAQAAARVRLAKALVQRVTSVPGVQSVSLLGPAMLGRATWVMSVFPREREARGPEDFVQVCRHSVNPGALANLGIAVLRGREFDVFDTAAAAPVAIISDSVARQLWPGVDPVGKFLRRPDPSLPPLRVVGVAADARHRQRYSLEDIGAGWPLGGLGPQRDLYLPYPQRPNPDVTVAVRLRPGASGPSEGLAEAVATLDPDLPVDDVRSLDDRLDEQNQAPAGIAALMSAYALLAILLAAVGIYGVMSQSVSGRTQEIGTRVALGAQRRDIFTMVLRESAILVAWGAAAGLAVALLVTRLMSSLLYGVSAKDPLTLAAAVPLLAFVALGACLLPARRAVRLDPIEALRCE